MSNISTLAQEWTSQDNLKIHRKTLDERCRAGDCPVCALLAKKPKAKEKPVPTSVKPRDFIALAL